MTDLTFLPWLRLGLTATPGPTVRPRIKVLADGAAHSTVDGPDLRLRGPGEVVAINPAAIRRRDPDAGATGVETNYFCGIEFFAPDLPWRYTPVSVDADGHLPPWLVLVVVEVGAGTGIGLDRGGGRLPVLTVGEPGAHLPDLADSWAWAHVQVATSLDGDVAGAYARDPGAFSSRLLCPRRLAAGTRYTACLVPAYESGRLSGLGLTAPGSPDPGSLHPAWSAAPVALPVYDSWEFTAGDRYDFASLARLITPSELPPDVGSHGLDLTRPGIGLPPVTSPVWFVGALRSPATPIRWWDSRHDERAFADAVRKLVNGVSHPRRESGDRYDPLVDDPVVSPPAYGAPQVGTATVPDSPDRPGWFEELNLGPQHRAVAGIGVQVVRHDQEALVAAAWEQARAAVEVNRGLNRGRLVQETARQAQRKWDRLDDATSVSIAAPALARIRVGDGDADSTAARLLDGGDAPSAYFGAAFRRLGRPGGPLATTGPVPAGRSPAVAIVGAAVASAQSTTGHPPSSPLSTVYRTRTLPAGMDIGTRLSGAPPQSVAARIAPQPSGGPIGYSGTIGQLHLQPIPIPVVRPVEYGRVVTGGTGQDRLGLDLVAAVTAAVRAPDSVLAAVRSRVVLPDTAWAGHNVPTRFELRPRFTDPMYERVVALSVDYLVPGVGAVPDNTLGLLEINPAFVEAVLVGLNHELSRELRWREYPAALGQTWFTHFWDHTDSAPDIAPIEVWPAAARLGQLAAHGRAPGLVALISAALIRRFPGVRVYAVPAVWRGGTRVPDETAEPLGPSFVGTLRRATAFYGFDGLTLAQARGDDGAAGWFFVLEEEPHATRFGLDRGIPDDRGSTPTSWANLSWANLADRGGTEPWFCTIDTVHRIETATLDGLRWGRDAAAMAGITLRRPVQVFMHASAMLPDSPAVQSGGTDNG